MRKDIMTTSAPTCRCCKKKASDLLEYKMAAEEEGNGMTPDSYVRENEGTYDEELNSFICTTCYVKKIRGQR